MAKLLIFDLDGTLIDSAPDIVSTTQELLRIRGREALADAEIVAAIGEGLFALVHSCFPESRDDDAALAEISDHFASIYDTRLLAKTQIFPGATDFLQQFLDDDPGNKVAIATNKRERWTKPTLAGLGLDLIPWVRVFCSDSLPERKPHPLPLLEAMRAAGVSREQTVMIGDGLPDMVAATRAGVHAIACKYGYCDATKLLDAGATGVADSFADMPRAIEAISRLAPRPISVSV